LPVGLARAAACGLLRYRACAGLHNLSAAFLFSSIEASVWAGITEINNPGDQELKMFSSKRSKIIAAGMAAI
jgi:hypothetical protein